MIRILSLFFVLVVSVAFTVRHDAPSESVPAEAASGSLSGYAWSDTVGWVSFSGSNYGIAVASDGTLSGYAWSDNIGWISANTSDLTGCPSGSCIAQLNDDGTLSGWLKATAGGSAESGGWDGFISLAGTGYGPERQEDGSFSGYAWGSDVIGWLDFQYASTDVLPTPSATLEVRKVGDTDWSDSLVIDPLDEVELTWNRDGASNTATCESVPPTNGFSTGGTTSGTDSDVIEPEGGDVQVFGLVCYSDSGTAVSDSVTVTTNAGSGAAFCPDIPTKVANGTSVDLCYELGTNDPGSCSITGGTVTILSPLTDTSGSVPSNPVTGEVTYTLSCVGGDSDMVTVGVLPIIQEI
jgi:hypothetical protein